MCVCCFIEDLLMTNCIEKKEKKTKPDVELLIKIVF